MSQKRNSLEHRENVKDPASQPETVAELQSSKTANGSYSDEALKVLGTWAGDETWEPQKEKKIVRRIDRTVLVLLTCTYGLQYYDKAMLAQAVSIGTQKTPKYWPLN